MNSAKLQLFPLLRISIFLILGIVVSDIWLTDISSITIEISVVVAIVVALLLYKWKMLQSVAILIAVFFFGALILHLYKNSIDIELPKNEVCCNAVLVNDPIVRGKVAICDMFITSGSLQGRKIKASILRDTINQRYESLTIGDGIMFVSQLEKPYTRGNSTKFDYQRWFYGHGYTAQTFIFYNKWQRQSTSIETVPIMERVRMQAMKLRNKILKRYKKLGLYDKNYSIVAAMTLGDKSALDKEVRNIYYMSGVSHILALSGLHLGIIYAIISLLLSGIRKRFLGQMLLLLSIWSYVVISGMSPSVVRAAIMLSAFTVVSLLRRDSMSLNTLSMTLIIMLVVNPLNLWDIGFQLSFVSVFGIIVSYKSIYHFVPDRFLFSSVIVKWIWSMMAVSLAAQLWTMPLVIYHFGQFSTLSLVSNLVAIPLATIILYTAFFMLLSTPIPIFQQCLAKILLFCADTLNACLSFIASISFGIVKDININALQVVLMYILIACICGLYHYLHKMYVMSRLQSNKSRC